MQFEREKMAKKNIKNGYLETLGMLVILLALVRCAFPDVAADKNTRLAKATAAQDTLAVVADTVNVILPTVEETNIEQKTEVQEEPAPVHIVSTKYLTEGEKPHRIFSVPDYNEAFPDTNDLQLTAARKWGVKPVIDRKDAEERMRELVFVGSNPYFHVDPLQASIPYLVPRASILLQDIGAAFFDSLQVKGVPLHRIIVTSVLRTQRDVKKLRNYNKNATENSCHLYGTTFDISHARFETVQDPEGPVRRSVRDDSLKFVLSEVLRDMRLQHRCYVKYERKQSCFHITVR